MGMSGNFTGVMGGISVTKNGVAFLTMMEQDPKYGNVKFKKFMFKDGRACITGDALFGSPIKVDVFDADKAGRKEGADYDVDFYFAGSAVLSESKQPHHKAA